MYTPPEYVPPEDPAEEPEHVARYLAPPIEAIWRAFDKGRAGADEFFASDHRKWDAHLWAHIARYEAVLSLKAEDEHPGWQVMLRHHSAIEVEQGPFKFRVCKAAGDGPQSPGHSHARRQFFQQLGMFSLFSGGHAANLLLYWRIRKNDLDLGLCKPKGLWRFKGVPKLEWQQPVAFDPLAGLSFPTLQDDDVAVGLHLEEEGIDGDVKG
jgi:hypothetical protein